MTISRDRASATGHDVVEAMVLPALLIDRDLVVRVANAAYLAGTGRRASDLVGIDSAVALEAAGLTGPRRADDLRHALGEVVRTRRPLHLDSDDLELVCSPVLVDGEVAGILVHAAAAPGPDQQSLAGEVAQLREALLSRATIDQAKGVLMARHGCDADRAFDLLTEMSNTSNVRLADVAAAIVYQVQRGGTVAGPDGQPR